MTLSDGQWVTPREFALMSQRMDGFERTLGDVAKDVKALLAAHNREEGAWTATAISSADHKDKGARRMALAGIVGTAGGAFWWIPSAIARLTHHS